jgi:hypothetical protein
MTAREQQPEENPMSHAAAAEIGQIVAEIFAAEVPAARKAAAMEAVAEGKLAAARAILG